jgi:iron-sulfur cluster repair protein YtfE (RIC family)
MVGKAAGALVGMFTPSSETNAIDLLKADHDKVQQMFDKVKASPNRDHRELFKKIKLELDTHAHIEETIFYPHLLKKGDKELKKIVREGLQEHAQMKMFLTSLSRMTNGKSENFKAKLQVLIEDTEHHVKEEENEMFPKVKDQIPSEKLEQLGAMMEAEKATFKKRRARSASRKRTTAAAAAS